MIELSIERVETILEKETPKTPEQATLLRAIYTRYMRLYEKYFADIDALNDEVIVELNQYHEETRSLVRYYYMDIPQDVCEGLDKFDDKYGSKLLGPDWHQSLLDLYKYFRDKKWNKSEERARAEFRKEALDAFYETMGSIFRPGFGSDSKAAERIVDGIKGMFFGGGEG
jgi:hypothetical protein